MPAESVGLSTDPKHDFPLVRFLTVYIPLQCPFKGHVIPLSEVSHVLHDSLWEGELWVRVCKRGGISRPVVLQVVCFATLALSALL